MLSGLLLQETSSPRLSSIAMPRTTGAGGDRNDRAHSARASIGATNPAAMPTVVHTYPGAAEAAGVGALLDQPSHDARAPILIF